MRTGGLLGWALAALLALSVGLAARPAQAPSRVELLLAALALPGGTIPTLCAPGEDGAPGAHEARCALCVLADAAVLPSAPTLAGRAPSSRGAAALPAPPVLAAPWPPAPPARGPPAPTVA